MSKFTSKIEQIRQMLAKAESTTPAEAEMITARVEKMMIQLGIDEAVLNEQAPAKDRTPIVKREVTLTGSYALTNAYGYSRVVQALGGMRLVRFLEPGSSQRLVIVGRETTVDRALFLLTSLQLQSQVAQRAWWKTVREDYRYDSESTKRKARTSYVEYFFAGAAKRIEEEKSEVVNASGPGTALVLANEQSEADNAVAEMFDKLRKTSRRSDPNLSAALAGIRDGERANVGTTSVGQQDRAQVTA